MIRGLARLACGALAAVLAAVLAVGASEGAVASAVTSSPAQVARAGVLRSSDFPAAWKQTRRQASSDNERDQRAARVGSCKPFLAFSQANTKNPRAKSPDFDLQQSHVNNAVSVYPSVAKVTAAMQRFTDPRVPDCLDQIYSAEFKAQFAKNKQVSKQLRSVDVKIVRLDGVQIGNEAAAYEGTVNVSLKDGTVTTIGLAVIAVRVDRALAQYSYTADTDISTALQPAIVSSVSRLQRATTAATQS